MSRQKRKLEGTLQELLLHCEKLDQILTESVRIKSFYSLLKNIYSRASHQFC